MGTAPLAETIAAERLRSFAGNVLRAVGMPDDDARTTADAMVWAELRDLPMHGVSGKLPQCVRRIRAGTTSAAPALSRVRESASSVLIDAKDAWGQVAGVHGMRAAIEKARATGAGYASVRNSSSAAAMGYYASLAIAAGMIGVAITNGIALMPPPGGTTKVVGNQGFALGAPASRHRPLLFDSALSLISTGEIHTAQERGEQLPPGLMLDASGAPTTDPAAALDGLYVPIGGHRGFGLALMWEVLTGVLAGGKRFAPDIGAPDDLTSPQGVSHFMLAIDPTRSMPLDEFTARVDQLIDLVHVSPPAEGIARIYVPGERGYETSERRLREGIPMTPKRLDSLKKLAAEMKVEW